MQSDKSVDRACPRVLSILHSHVCGGAETNALDLMKALRNRGFEPVLACPGDGWLARQARACGIRVIDVPLHGLFDVGSLARLIRAVRHLDIRLVHGHLVRGTHYATLLGWLCRIPHLASAHATNAHRRFGRAQHVVAVSRAVAEHLLAHGVQTERLTVIHHGITDPTAGAPARKTARQALGLAPDTFAIGVVARFIEDKGHDLIVAAARELQEYPVHFFLAGEASGPWADKIRTLIHACGLEDRFTLPGHVDDVPALLAGMDLLVAPSRREALSLSLIEACAMAVPAVATSIGGIPEVITHGSNGLLVPANDAHALAHAIETLMTDADLRQQMSANARATYLKKFSSGRMSGAYENLYRTLIHGTSPSPVDLIHRPG